MRKITLFICLIFGLTALPITSYAQEDQTNPQRLEVEKRISDRKSRIKLQLSSAEEQIIKSRCTGAQTKLSVLQANAQKHSEQNDQKANKIIEKINALRDKLEDKGYDTQSLENVIAVVEQKNQALQQAYQNYINALSDASKNDCKADPEGFKASLEEARIEFKEIKTARMDLRKTFREQLKEALEDIRNNKL